MLPLPPGPFSIIYADPPWAYRDKREKHPRLCGGVSLHYPVMSTQDICALPVQEIATKDCLLFLWATWPNLPEAFKVIEAWGFKYKTCAFCWVKTNKNNGKPFFGIGHYTKSNSEPCLLAVRGKPPIASNSVSQIVMSPRRDHSRKPYEVLDRIVQLCGDVPRLEMFARETPFGWLSTKGWMSWGLEVDSEYKPRKLSFEEAWRLSCG